MNRCNHECGFNSEYGCLLAECAYSEKGGECILEPPKGAGFGESGADGSGGRGYEMKAHVVLTGVTYPPTTNGDRIRSMNDDELAKYLFDVE